MLLIMDYIWYVLGYQEEEKPKEQEDKASHSISKTVDEDKEMLTYVDELKDKLSEPNKGLRKTETLINLLA